MFLFFMVFDIGDGGGGLSGTCAKTFLSACREKETTGTFFAHRVGLPNFSSSCMTLKIETNLYNFALLARMLSISYNKGQEMCIRSELTDLYMKFQFVGVFSWVCAYKY